jgi:DNA-binding GntR family transcriptional regulator
MLVAGSVRGGWMDANLDVVSREQLKDVVYARIRAALVDLTIAPGEPLREAALVKQLGVSKTPIREALVRLERDGLVELTPYRGARARVYSAEDLREICELREVIEGECVRRAAHRMEPDFHAALRENIEATDKAAAAGNQRKLAELLDRFDELMLTQLRNSMLIELIDRVRLHLRRIGGIAAAMPGRSTRSAAQHREIYDAIEQKKPALADRCFRNHLRSILDDQLTALNDAPTESRPAARGRAS